MAKHNELGKWGEDYAADYLHSEGYIILDRDWRNGGSKRDIDIVCKSADRSTIVFVEVKTRSSDDLTAPEDAVNVGKMRRIGRAADGYVKMYDVVEELRFDILTVIGQKDSDDIQINHIKDAFNPLLI